MGDIGGMSADPLSASSAVHLLHHIGFATLIAMAPFLLGVVGITLLVNVVQARGVISTEALGPKLEHISPLAGFKRLFSLDAVFNVLKALVKVLVIGWVAWLVLQRAWPEILSTSGAERAAGARG